MRRRPPRSTRLNPLFPYTTLFLSQLFVFVHQLFARLGRKLEIRPLDDRIDRTGFLTEPAIDALGHVDVVAGRPPAAVGPRLRLDRDRERRADRLAELAGDAALLAVRITDQHVPAAEERAGAPPPGGIVQGDLRLDRKRGGG